MGVLGPHSDQDDLWRPGSVLPLELLPELPFLFKVVFFIVKK